MTNKILSKLFDKYVERTEPYKLVQAYLDVIASEYIQSGKPFSGTYNQLCEEVSIYEDEFRIDEDRANYLAIVGGCDPNENTSLSEFWLNVQKNFDEQLRLLTDEIRRTRIPTEQEVSSDRKKNIYTKLFNALQNYQFWVYYDETGVYTSDHQIFVNQILSLDEFMKDETQIDSHLFSFRLRTEYGQYTQILLSGTSEGSKSFSAVGIDTDVWRTYADTPEELLDRIFQEQYRPSEKTFKKHMDTFKTIHITV